MSSLPWPIATTYASLNVTASAEFLITNLGATLQQTNKTFPCTEVEEVSVVLPGSDYEVRFVNTPNLASKEFSFSDYVDYAHNSYGNISLASATSYSQFMDFHVGFITEDMTPFYSKRK